MYTFRKSFFHIRQLLNHRQFNSKFEKVLEKHEIIPEIIDTTPNEIATINYPCCINVELGNILTPTQVKYMPTVKWNNCQHNGFHTICMIDPDAPSRTNPTLKEWNHWLVGNIPGSLITKGCFLSAYIGAAPPRGTGLHRYIFLIYKQSNEIDFHENILLDNSIEGRACFSIKQFTEKYQLGKAIACNFFQAEWDDYVPTIYKQLGQ